MSPIQIMGKGKNVKCLHLVAWFLANRSLHRAGIWYAGTSGRQTRAKLVKVMVAFVVA